MTPIAAPRASTPGPRTNRRDKPRSRGKLVFLPVHLGPRPTIMNSSGGFGFGIERGSREIKMTLRRVFIRCLPFVLCGLGTGAQALVLTPGGSGLTTGATFSAANVDVAAPVVVGITPFAFSSGNLAGTLYQQVRQRSSVDARLDFFYRIDSTGADNITRMTTTNYLLFDTEVDWLGDFFAVGSSGPTGGTASSAASRSSAGSIVRFDFGGSALSGLSRWLLIRTNATAYTSGRTSVIDGDTETIVGTFAPVPEPATLSLACLALVAAARRRTARRSPAA